MILLMLQSPMQEYTPYTIYECWRQGASIQLTIALMRGESDFNPLARGRVNTDGSYDFGPMQLNSNRYYPGMSICENISCGIAHLMVEYKKFGNAISAVWAYNAGAGKVGKILPPQTYRLMSRVFGKRIADIVRRKVR